jgi:hypothetical protein
VARSKQGMCFSSGSWVTLELNFNTFNYSVNNFVKWACGINDHTVRYIFFGGMKTKYQFFFLFIPAPIVKSTTIKSLLECFGIQVQYKYFVE